jgi:ASC-1-like (ASCH) protein
VKKHILKFRALDRDKFEAVKSGAKAIETRAGTVAYKKIQAGDVLVIKCGGEVVEKTVRQVSHFKSVQDVVNSPDFGKILPWASNLEEAEKTYYSFPGYKEKIAQHGILAFYLV